MSADGSSRLTTKLMSGTGGYAPGHPVQNKISTLTKEETTRFLEKIDGYEFWTLPAFDASRIGLDGAHWVIEGVKNGTYRVVARWSPRDGSVRAIGLFMLNDLAELNPPSKETY